MSNLARLRALRNFKIPFIHTRLLFNLAQYVEDSKKTEPELRVFFKKVSFGICLDGYFLGADTVTTLGQEEDRGKSAFEPPVFRFGSLEYLSSTLEVAILKDRKPESH